MGTGFKSGRYRRKDGPLPPPGGYLRKSLEAWELGPNDIRRAIHQEELRRAGYGVYRPSNPLHRVSSEWALLQALACDPRHLATGVTAATLWGIYPGQEPAGLSFPLYIATAQYGTRVRRKGQVISCRVDVPEHHRTVHRGIHVVSPSWAWLEIALKSSAPKALAWADRFLASPRRSRGESTAAERPTVTAADLEEAVLSRGRAVGIGTAREVVPLARVGADSFPESMLRYYILQEGLPEPEVNPLIGDRLSGQCFRPDLAFCEWRVSVQYEGTAVHSDPERVLRDIRRAEVTERLGWVEVRIAKEHMRDGGHAACAKIRAVLIAQGYTPPNLKGVSGLPRS